jgi:hypothetical protein
LLVKANAAWPVAIQGCFCLYCGDSLLRQRDVLHHVLQLLLFFRFFLL